jgi:hypothetical protein
VSVFADSCEYAAGKVGRSEGGEKTRSIFTRKEERSLDRVDLVFLCDYII